MAWDLLLFLIANVSAGVPHYLATNSGGAYGNA
jgi:hypothetical protein